MTFWIQIGENLALFSRCKITAAVFKLSLQEGVMTPFLWSVLTAFYGNENCRNNAQIFMDYFKNPLEFHGKNSFAHLLMPHTKLRNFFSSKFSWQKQNLHSDNFHWIWKNNNLLRGCVISLWSAWWNLRLNCYYKFHQINDATSEYSAKFILYSFYSVNTVISKNIFNAVNH